MNMFRLHPTVERDCCHMAAAATRTDSDQPMSILSRVERLDLMMSYLEEVKGRAVVRSASTTSSSGTTAMSDAGNSSSVNSSPKSLEKRCRPMDDVVVETQVKGSLIERVDQLESRLLKLEEDADIERKRGAEEETNQTSGGDGEKKRQKKGLKSLVKSCMRGSLRTKD